MSIVARHEIVRELAGNALVQVSRVKTPSKPDGSLVLKRCRLLQDGFSDRRSAVTSFLDSARVQQAAAKVPDSHWAPVHELVEDADGGHYVTDFYPSSAQRLVNGQVRLSGQALFAVARSVLKGLLALRKAADRSHGNLKPTNVLIAGADEIGEGDVFLADPADSANPAAHDGGADDLFRLGQLIHQLVLHQPFRPVVGWPIAPSPAWSRFGYAGRRWREFCNHLLDPNALARPGTVEAALAELERVGRRPIVHWVAGAAVAAAVVAAVGTGLVVHGRNKQIRQDAQALAAEHEGWFRSFAALVDSLPAEVVPRDEYIAENVVAPINEGLLSEAMGGRNLLNANRVRDLYTNPPSAFDDARAAELREVLALVRRTESALSNWEFASWLEQRRRDYAERGWDEVAAYFGGLADGVKPKSENAGARLEHVLRHRTEIRRYAAAIDEIWRAIDPKLVAIKANAAGAVAPLWFEQYVRGAPGSFDVEVDSPADLEAFHSRLKELDVQCDEFARFVPPGWAESVALPRLLDDEAADVKQGRAVSDWPYFRAWGRKLDQYRLQSVPPDVVDALARALKESEPPLQQLRALKAPPESLNEFEGRLAKLREQVAQLPSQKFTREEADGRRRAVEGLIRQYGSDVADAVRRLRPPEKADVWYAAATRQLNGAEPPVVRAWQRLLAQLVPRPVARLDEDNNAQQYVQLRDQVAAWANALRAIPPQFPTARSGEPFESLIAERRLAALEDAASRAVAAGRPDAGDTPFAEVRGGFEKWLNEVRDVGGHWQAARELLESRADLDAKGRTGLSLTELDELLRQSLAGGNFPEAVAKQVTTELAAVERMRKDYETAAALRRDADALKAEGSLPQALKLYEEVAKLRPNDPVAAAQAKEVRDDVEERAKALLAQAEGELAAKNLDAAADTIARLKAWAPGGAHEGLGARLDALRADAGRREVQPLLDKAAEALRRQYDPRQALAVLAQSDHPDAAALRKSIQELVGNADRNATAGDQSFAQRDHHRASDRYVAAAQGGSHHALYRLGVMSRDGLSGPPAERSPEGWFKLAAARGNADAARALEEMENAARAVTQVGQTRDPAPADDADAQLAMAQRYERGDGGVDQNWTMAVTFYRRAAKNGSAAAMFRIAQLHEKGSPGVPRSTRLARDMYTQAARAGHAGARAWLKDNPVKRAVDRTLIDNTRQ